MERMNLAFHFMEFWISSRFKVWRVVPEMVGPIVDGFAKGINICVQWLDSVHRAIVLTDLFVCLSLRGWRVRSAIAKGA